VQKSIRAQAGAAEIRDIIKGVSENRVIYKVLFANPGVYPTLCVAADGTVLDASLAPVRSAARESGGVWQGKGRDDLRLRLFPDS
jgi:hypothetical protein